MTPITHCHCRETLDFKGLMSERGQRVERSKSEMNGLGFRV